MLEQLCEIEIPGHGADGLTVGDALDLAHADHQPAVELLAGWGIAYTGGHLRLEIFHPSLAQLLLSPLQRERGAVVDVARGVLSIPLEVQSQ